MLYQDNSYRMYCSVEASKRFKRSVFSIFTFRFNFKTPAFFPQNKKLCYVWFPQQRKIDTTSLQCSKYARLFFSV